MTEEEKKAIEFFEKRQKYMGDYRGPLEENTDIVLNIIKKQQKEIEKKDKRIKSLQTIVAKDLPTNQECISTFCGIPIEEAIDMIEICKVKTIHLSDEEYRKVIELAQADSVSKTIIQSKMNILSTGLNKLQSKSERYTATEYDKVNELCFKIDILEELLEANE